MSTGGLNGFIIDGVEKVFYVNWDAYPSGVGMWSLQFCRDTTDWDGVRQRARDLVVVDEDDAPSEEQMDLLFRRVGEVIDMDARNWGVTLSKVQGRLGLILAAGFVAYPGVGMTHGEGTDVQYGYVVDLDKNEFRAYAGTFSERLMRAWPLDALPVDADFLSLGD